MRRARLVIADRHPIVLQGLMSVLAAQGDFEVVASCNSGTSFIEAVRSLAPDVALLGDSLPDATASEILAIADAENLPTRFVFFTSSIEQGDLAAAIVDGACSNISKYESPESLLQSLRKVTEGIGLLPEPSPDLVPTGKEASSPNMENVLAALTDREREIIRLVAEGLSNKAIGRQLNISEGTIKVHLHHIYQKLEINNRTVLATFALSQRYGGLGMLSLAALTFAAMSETKAADPNETILDDDNIAYKDLEHGVFELWTKEAVPRHIVVEDPGRTIVLTRTGSSVSVNQVANSAARMDELQAAQQAVLANFAKGYGPGGSGTPYDYNLPTLQPINYVQPGGPTTQATLPPLEFAPNPILEVPLPPPPPPVPPSLNPAAGPTLNDTATFDTFAASPGIFAASSPRQDATLTFSISGGTAGNVVVDGITYDVSKIGAYGTLYLNSTNGAYIYVPNDDAINALSAPTTESFTITVWDGTLSAAQTFTVAINGANDAAVITGSASGAVVEAGGVANASAGTLTATGTLADTDVDNPANTFTAVTSPTASNKGYGTFTMTAAGVWSFTLDNSNAAVQALNAGETLTDTFTVTTVDGTAQVVTITITGSNDAAVISGDTTGSVIEAGGVEPGTPVASGTLTDTDVDNDDNSFVAVTTATASNKGYGTFTMTAAGVWSYTLDNSNAAVQALNAGETLIDTITVTTVDGTTQVVTITIKGTNDAAIISGTTAGSVIEAGVNTPGTPQATGALAADDPDNAANAFIAVNSPTQSEKGYGAFIVTAAGVWTYTLNNANPAVQALNAGETLTDTFTVSTVDGTTQMVTITIAGSNDAAIISGTTTGSVIEAGGADPGTPIATGTLTDIDVDNEDNTFIAVTSPAKSHQGYGTFMITAAGAWTYTLDNANAAVQALDPGETLTDTFTVATIDGTTQLVTIVIHGSSDADPNDFDNLALGDHVINDPPFVYGTPNGETIAGGGDVFQIVYAGKGNDTVNGTSLGDILYGGSGNDTMKGNGGDDTIYGGSGSDDINGNNGNDTIVGGFGADKLTGSNGDDVFVYLSVADSNSAQFDIITDFASGSDKINLAAFGALAFLHLASSATSVPPHTLAWIYNGASNETIVYVNPTDGALDIGDAALLEIHLQGVTSVSESDFIYEKAAARAVVAAGEAIDPALQAIAAAETVVLTLATAAVYADTADGTGANGSGWTLQAAGDSFNFDFDRNDGSSGSVRLAYPDEASASAAAGSDGYAVTPASGSAVELWHESPTEGYFTFHHGPIHASAVSETAATSSSGATEPAAFTTANAVAASQLAEHGAKPGGAASLHQSQHELHAASAETDPNDPHSESKPTPPGHQDGPASAGHAEIEGPPGHGSSLHSSHGVGASHHTDPVELEAAGIAPASIAHGHGAGSAGQSAKLEAATLSPAEEHAAGHAQSPQEPGHGSSFHFKDAPPSQHAGPLELEEVGPASSAVAHAYGAGHGGPPTIHEIAGLGETEAPASAHAEIAQAHVAQVHAASHGHHLIV